MDKTDYLLDRALNREKREQAERKAIEKGLRALALVCVLSFFIGAFSSRLGWLFAEWIYHKLP